MTDLPKTSVFPSLSGEPQKSLFSNDPLKPLFGASFSQAPPLFGNGVPPSTPSFPQNGQPIINTDAKPANLFSQGLKSNPFAAPSFNLSSSQPSKLFGDSKTDVMRQQTATFERSPVMMPQQWSYDFIMPNRNGKVQTFQDVIDGPAPVSVTPDNIQDLQHIFRSQPRLFGNLIFESIAEQANQISKIQNNSIADCIQWFSAAYLSRNTPEVIQKLIRGQVPNQDPLSQIACGHFQSAAFKFRELEASLNSLARTFTIDCAKIGSTENSEFFKQDVQSRQTLPNSSPAVSLLQGDKDQIQKVSQTWQQHAILTLLSSMSDSFVETMQASFKFKPTNGLLNQLYDKNPIEFLGYLSQEPKNLAIVCHLALLYWRLNFPELESYERLKVFYAHCIGQFIERCHHGLTLEQWTIYVQRIDFSEHKQALAVLKLAKYYLEELGITRVQKWMMQFENQKVTEALKLIQDSYVGNMLEMCVQPEVAHAASHDLLDKFANKLLSEVWKGDFRRLQWIYDQKDQLGQTPSLLRFLFTVLEIKKGCPKLEDLIMSDVGERHFKPAFALVVDHLEGATVSKRALAKFQQLVQTTVYDYQPDSVSPDCMDLYRKVQHVLQECTFKHY